MTCSIPGICSKSPECRDKHCEGFPTRRVLGLEQRNGGKSINTDDLYEEDAFTVVLCQCLLVAVTVICLAAVFLAWLES